MKLSADEAEAQIDQILREAGSASLREAVTRLEELGESLPNRLRDRRDEPRVRQSVFRSILSQIMIKRGDAQTYSDYLLRNSSHDFIHPAEKYTLYCVSAQLWRSDGDLPKAIKVLEGALAEVRQAPSDEFVRESIRGGERLLSVLKEQRAG